MSNINQLFIRTDANSKIGIGHFMRCLALAQTWKKHGGKVTFIGAYEDAFILNRITKEGFELIFIEDSYPNPFDLEITNTTDQPKAATATNQLKEATVETGARVRVPPFIEVGQIVKINTETGEYLGKA